MHLSDRLSLAAGHSLGHWLMTADAGCSAYALSMTSSDEGRYEFPGVAVPVFDFTGLRFAPCADMHTEVLQVSA
jgi:hypothetical protein